MSAPAIGRGPAQDPARAAAHDFMPALFGLEYATYGTKPTNFVVSFLLHTLTVPGQGQRGAAELASAGVLTLSTCYIVLDETFANWQSLWLCATLLALAISLARVRGAPS